MKQTHWDPTDTHETDTLGPNLYKLNRHIGTQLIHMKQTHWDPTDTHETGTLGPNRYT